MDVNVTSATNRDLEWCVHEGKFRSDLYFRLNVLRLHLPPLRERRGDIALLAEYFVESLVDRAGPERRCFAPAALRKLERYDWPGNIRELLDVVQRALVFSATGQILPSQVCLPVPSGAFEAPGGNFRQARASAIERFERLYVEEILRKHHGNITRAAVDAGKDRRAFARLAKKHSIDRRAL